MRTAHGATYFKSSIVASFCVGLDMRDNDHQPHIVASHRSISNVLMKIFSPVSLVLCALASCVQGDDAGSNYTYGVDMVRLLITP